MNTLKTTASQIIGWYREGSFPALFTDSVAVVKQWLEQGHKVSGVIRHDGLAVEAAPAAPAAGDALAAAARDVLAERERQISAEGWTPDHDDEYKYGQLASAAGCYAMFTQAYPPGDPVRFWPWSPIWWKPSADPRRNLVVAGSLILAEIERLDRAAIAAQQGGK